jgi:hypothetical protein
MYANILRNLDERGFEGSTSRLKSFSSIDISVGILDDTYINTFAYLY